MDQYYLKELTVPIPEDRLAVIRKGKSVEYETDRIYSPETKNTRVVRRVIGKVDPVNPGRMFPNETYFQLFPENEVPEEVRDEFLRGCGIKRQMQTIRRNPEEIIEGVVNGLSELRVSNAGDGSLVPHSCNCEKPSPCSTRAPFGYVMLRRLFDDIYYSVEELAGKYPNEVMAPYKVKQINEVLEKIRGNVQDEGIRPYLRLIEEPEEAGEDGKSAWKGLTYSDILMMLKWYKVLPR
ncbi:MAG: hypothetical protein IJU38_01915 [Clostridia bacterium]|nr:hypothetical protein [Clostridia bacterium]